MKASEEEKRETSVNIVCIEREINMVESHYSITIARVKKDIIKIETKGHLTGEAGTQQEHHLHHGRDLHDRKHHYNILEEHAKKDLIENMINDASREEDLTKNLIKDAFQNLETKPTDEEANVLKTHYASGIGRHLFSTDRKRSDER